MSRPVSADVRPDAPRTCVDSAHEREQRRLRVPRLPHGLEPSPFVEHVQRPQLEIGSHSNIVPLFGQSGCSAPVSTTVPSPNSSSTRCWISSVTKTTSASTTPRR